VGPSGASPAPLRRPGGRRPLQRRGGRVSPVEVPPAAPGRPALPRRIEASNGDAKVRLLVDQWGQGTP
ncbi:lipoprotein localization factor LolB, partial [Stenotrophomonas maltophilia]|nr:lipoprotein localization factor LolB [Stenotrophomonas maltophilia]